MLIPDWIFNLILIIISVRLLIWVYVFYKWMANWYTNDKGILRFLKKIGRWLATLFAFFMVVSVVGSFFRPLLFRKNGTVILVEGDIFLEQRHLQQYFSPDYTFANGETLELSIPKGDSALLMNNSNRAFILWEAGLDENDEIDQKRLKIIAPYSSSVIPDRISCISDAKTLSECIPEHISAIKPTYHLSY